MKNDTNSHDIEVTKEQYHNIGKGSHMKPTEKKIRIKIEPSIHMKDAHYALIFSEDSNYVKGEITWDGVITTPENLDDVINILGTADVNLYTS